MATSERSTRAPFDGDLRRALLDAALASVAVDDPANLSLRAVAREVGVSHAAPKNHFGDKTGLLTAIAIEGFQRLGHDMIVAAAAAPSPLQALTAGGARYVGFAIEHPGYFRVMWRNELLDRDDPDLDRSSELALDGLRQMIESAQDAGWAPGRPAMDLAVLAWSAVHGLAQLYLDGPLGALVEDDIEHLTGSMVELIRVGFEPGAGS
ncbi:MAG: TetR/AcrR family transcriptional regulator [Actinomycetota bacterium]